MRDLAAGAAVERAGAAHLLQLALELDDALGDLTPVKFKLAFAGAAGGAGAAPLALKVSPGADQARTLVLQPGEVDLQLAFAGAGAAGENLQDQAGAVHHLGVPGLFQVALLHGAELVVHHHHVDAPGLRQDAELLQLALAEQSGGRDGAERRDLGRHDVQVEGLGEADGLLQARVRVAERVVLGTDGVDDERVFALRTAVDELVGFVGQSSVSSLGSYSCTGTEGMMVEIACL